MKQIDEVIAQVFNVKQADLNDEISMDNVSYWDSLRNMELIAAIEDNFSIELSFEEISDMTTVGKVREIVSKKIQ
jgi:acyl carrier protein